MTQTPASSTTPAPDAFEVDVAKSLQDRPLVVMKTDDTYGVFGQAGDILCSDDGPDGLYHNDTRHLSRLQLTLEGQPLKLLGASVSQDGVLLDAGFSNASLARTSGGELDQGAVFVERTRYLLPAGMHERLSLSNYTHDALQLRLEVVFDADFADMFEVRGARRARRGVRQRAEFGERQVVLGYMGLDGLLRRTRLRFSVAPVQSGATSAIFLLELAPRGCCILEMEAACETGEDAPPQVASSMDFEEGLRAAVDRVESVARRSASIHSSSDLFDEALLRADADMAVLITQTAQGPVPYAGVPWFSTVFGRDSLLTAYLELWRDPSLALGVLRYLSGIQATASDAATDAEPGKIIHETRRCEMAMTGEVPFRRYYGSTDTTPLFVVLAGAYLRRTGDMASLEPMMEHVWAAVDWMSGPADADGDLFVEYSRRSHNGIANQGWKDSWDSISHSDGTLASGPIALCEVQGYVYAALRAAGELARAVGQDTRACAVDERADALQEAFDQAFWLEEMGTYALALDGDKKPCAVLSSNPGHLLFTGILSAQRAAKVAGTLMSPDMFSGFGIRTLGRGERRYNPTSYHNGSVWPHDNALAAAGMARYGMTERAQAILEGMAGAAALLPGRRLPELFCGFERRAGRAPINYPVACSPQAWASATLPSLVASALGLEVDAEAGRVRLHHPRLPHFLERLVIADLPVGPPQATRMVSLAVSRSADGASMGVERLSGDVVVELSQ